SSSSGKIVVSSSSGKINKIVVPSASSGEIVVSSSSGKINKIVVPSASSGEIVVSSSSGKINKIVVPSASSGEIVVSSSSGKINKIVVPSALSGEIVVLSSSGKINSLLLSGKIVVPPLSGSSNVPWSGSANVLPSGSSNVLLPGFVVPLSANTPVYSTNASTPHQQYTTPSSCSSRMSFTPESTDYVVSSRSGGRFLQQSKDQKSTREKIDELSLELVRMRGVMEQQAKDINTIMTILKETTNRQPPMPVPGADTGIFITV
uniref:Uncharacterized protein n=1 Tax=Clytia hemisphaerica TaxID=252671 RepID=A0A7M5WU71_9CNID